VCYLTRSQNAIRAVKQMLVGIGAKLEEATSPTRKKDSALQENADSSSFATNDDGFASNARAGDL
jgi:hypothetical protein